MVAKKTKSKIPTGSSKDPAVELVFGIAGPVGADLELVTANLSDALNNADYDVHVVRLSEWIEKIASELDLTDSEGREIKLVASPEEERIRSFMDAGNAIRRETGEGAAVAHAAIAGIHDRRRQQSKGRPTRTAYILRSLKHEEEVFLLRRVYGPGFFLVGIHIPRETRVELLAQKIRQSHGVGKNSRKLKTYRKAAEGLVERDEREIDDPMGQRLRDVFQLADVFVRMRRTSEDDEDNIARALERFIELVLSNPFITPTDDERLMYLAYASSLSSGALGRQVGAVLASPNGEVLGVGWNDVPSPGGGLYREGVIPDERDVHRSMDSSQEHSKAIVDELLNYLRNEGVPVPEDLPGLSKLSVMSLLEFGRATHAEMEAIVSAARSGVSVLGSILYSTTFPCHECARLIVTAGVTRVVFVEPYPKSRALVLHDDAMSLDPADDAVDDRKIVVESFEGVGPRRFAELFSIMPTFGNRLERKNKAGVRLLWDGSTSQPRTPLVPLSYLELEKKSLQEVKDLLDKKSE